LRGPPPSTRVGDPHEYYSAALAATSTRWSPAAPPQRCSDIGTLFGCYKLSGFGGRDNGLEEQYTELRRRAIMATGRGWCHSLCVFVFQAGHASSILVTCSMA
jgi:hypothetical protein